MRIINILLIIFFLFVHITEANELQVQLKEVIVIGDDENAPVEYLFSRISSICTDNQNNIYVAQQDQSTIKVFNRKGHFIKSIGRKGQGPGEMQNIISMMINNDDELIVVDALNHRITKFINMGKDFKTYPIPVNRNISAWHIFQLDSLSYIFYYHLRPKSLSLAMEKDHVFHVVDKDFSAVNNSFGCAGEMWNFSEPFLHSQVGNSGSNLYVVNHNKIVFVPKFYYGNLYMYQFMDKEWKLEVLQGMKVKQKPYKILKRSDYPNGNYPIWSMSSSGPGYSFLAQQRNISNGLFSLNDGRIVHFSRTLDRNRKSTTFGIELWDNKGKFVGYGEIQKSSSGSTEQNYFDEVLWKDENDHFYIRAFNKEGFQIIQVVKLVLS